MNAILKRYRTDSLSYLRGGQGSPLLLIHGIPGSSHSWKPAGEHLASQYDVIIPDLGGFGESSSFDRFDHDLYMEAHADALHRLLVTLKIRQFSLAGHDFGGPVALTLLRLFPNQAAEALVLSATNAFSDPYVPLPLRLASVPVLGTAFFRLFAGTRFGLRLMYWVAAHNKSTFQIDDFERHLTSSGIAQTRHIFQRSLADLHGSYEKIEAFLPSLDVPTLVLWGDRDPFFPVTEAKRLANTLPHATLTILKETGHFVPEERPEMVAWHVHEFLQAPLRCTGTRRAGRSTSNEESS